MAKNNNDRRFPEKKDLGYIIFMLVVVIVVLITLRLGHVEELVDYIGFGVTLASLFLAIIAIIYSFHQNSTYASANEKLQSSAEKIEIITNELSEVKDLKPLINNFGQEVKHIQNNISDLKGVVSIIEYGVNNLNQNQNEIFERLTITNLGNEENFNKSEFNIKNTISYDREYFEQVVDKLYSVSAIVFVWLRKAYSHSVYFNVKNCAEFIAIDIMLEEKESIIKERVVSYMDAIQGILVAYGQIDYFNVTIVNKNNYKVNYFNDTLANVIDEGTQDNGYRISMIDSHYEMIETRIEKQSNSNEN